MHKTKLIKYITMMMFLSFWSGQGSAMEKPITHEYMLENGLKIVVREDNRAPVVVSQIWYKVGASDEHRPITGLSHALEHMMFKGTPTIPGDGFSRLIASLGGRENAFTGDDYTGYYEELDTVHLETAFKAEADRMAHLSLPPEEFAKELQVVIEERRLRTDDNPMEVTHERFMAAANMIGPYHHPVIGWREDLDNMTVESLRDWYERWYAPNNATLVVVGDVKPEKVLALAKKYFGPVPSKTLSPTTIKKDLKPLGQTRLKVEIPAKLPYLLMGYDVPTLTTTDNPKEVYALLVASAVLDAGNSARFAKKLIRDQEIAVSASTYYDPFKKYETQFLIAGIPSEGESLLALENAFLKEVETLKTEKVPQGELERIKNQLIAQEVFERDSMSEQAMLLGLLETVGLSWKVGDQLVENIQAITPDDVQMVAKKYLDSNRLTVAELIPQKMA